MRRGFYGWDESDLPLATLDVRRARVQAALREAGLDGLLIYTNIARPAGVSWLTGFTPYWSEGLLFVPPQGAPDFATALSKRVGEWMRSVTPTGSIVCTPQPAALFGKRLAETGAKRLGVLELDMLPGGQAATLLNSAPHLELVDASDLVRAIRRDPDASELALFAKAAALAEDGLALIDTSTTQTAFAHMGAVERHARLGRAEEVFVTLAPDLTRGARFLRVDKADTVGAHFAVRASVAYKSTWVRRTRAFSREAGVAAQFAACDATLARCASTLDGARAIAPQLAEAFSAIPGAKLNAFTLEACRGSYPLEIIAGTDSQDEPQGNLRGCVLSAEVALDGVTWVGGLPLKG